MPMNCMRYIIPLLFVVSLSRAVAQETNSAPLRACDEIPISAIYSGIPVEITTAQFSLYPDHSVSSISIKNKAQKSIVAILVLVNYLDNANQHILTGIYYGQQHSLGFLPLRSQVGMAVLRFEEAIKPERDRRIAFASDVVTPQCPTQGMVTRVSVTFDDGTTWSHSSPGWKTDPSIRETQHTDVTTFPGQLPCIFLATVYIDSDGSAAVKETDNGTGAAIWLQRQLENWSILPAEHGPLAKGKEKLTLAVVLHKSPNDDQIASQSPLRFHNSELPHMVVEILPSRRSGYSFVFVGGTLASQHALPDSP